VNLINFFSSERAPTISLSGREFALLDAIRRTEPIGACAADLQRAIAAETGKDPRLATLYGAILDLQRKGLVETSGSALAEAGGRPRRLFKLTRNGHLALTLGEAMASDASALAPA
jgi:hypothetical protein